MVTFLRWLENYQDENPEMRGEYWIEPGGTLLSADDWGDTNHEGHVIQQMQSHIADIFGVDDEVWESAKESIAGEVYRELRQELEDHKDQAEEEEDEAKLIELESQIQKLDYSWNDKDIYGFLYKAVEDHGMTHNEVSIADGQGDARLYAMKNWKWKRVENNHIETWSLTPQDIDDIINGMYEIAGGDSGQDLTNLEVNIHVGANNSWHQFTYGDLEHMLHPTPQAIAPQVPARQIPAMDRNSASLNTVAKAADNHQKDQDIQHMHPHYANKKFPFADWSIRTHGEIF